MSSFIVKRGDVYYAELNSFGSEQGGRRPVVIVQNDAGNTYAPTTIVAPLTTAINKKRLPTHVDILPGESGLSYSSTVLAEQLRTIDKNRLIKYVGKVGDQTMKSVGNAVAISCGLAV